MNNWMVMISELKREKLLVYLYNPSPGILCFLNTVLTFIESDVNFRKCAALHLCIKRNMNGPKVAEGSFDKL